MRGVVTAYQQKQVTIYTSVEGEIGGKKMERNNKKVFNNNNKAKGQ